MTPFAALLDRLVYTPSRNGKLRLMARYFREVPDPDRGWGLAALTGGLDFPNVKGGTVRALALERLDATLFALSYDYVGDLAETVALLWQGRGANAPPDLATVVERLQSASRSDAPARLALLLDGLDATGRWALLKLVTGGMRVGVSARLAKTALAEGFGRPVEEIEELWHGLAPPFAALFAWLEGNADKPDIERSPVFRPFMLAHPLDDGEELPHADLQVEWKWDGIRVQLVARGGERRVYSRSGDEIGGTFPEVVESMDFDGVIDGELLVRGEAGEPASFNALQQRLNRKRVTAKMIADAPAYVCAYDLLYDGGEDLRPLPLSVRRKRLEAFVARHANDRLALSDVLAIAAWDDLARLQREARTLGREGLMLKRRDAPYVAGRVKGLWYKWKRDPHTADAVLMYAQYGHGKRGSFYSDYTFGVWRGDELVPVGKAYFGFTDEELKRLDRWIRNHTVNRFGPVREVEKALVLEVAFDSVHPSPRHKSGLAMRFPRVARIRWDKPAAEADRIETLAAMAEAMPAEPAPADVS